MLSRKKAQSTLEYVIILAAIVAVILVGREIIKNAVDQGLKDAATSITDATGSLP